MTTSRLLPPSQTAPQQPDAETPTRGDLKPTVTSLTMRALRNARFLLLFDLVAFGLLAIASPRPTGPPLGAMPTAAQTMGMVMGVLIAGSFSARWAAQKGASAEVQFGFAIVANVLYLAAIVGFLVLWSLVGSPPGTSWLDSVAPRISSTIDPVGDVLAASFLMLAGLNVAWSAVSGYRRRTPAVP